MKVFFRSGTNCVFLVLMLFCSECLLSLPSEATQKKTGDDLLSVSFVDEKTGWSCGRWGAVLQTMDGGKTWRQQESGTDYTLISISFVDRQKGWAEGDMGTIIHTQDGGQSWEKQQSPVKHFLFGG